MNSITTKMIRTKKQNGEKIVMITAYDYPSALLCDAHVDIILVGDSMGNVVLGYDETTYVTIDDIKRCTAAVARGASNAMIVADMPFLSISTGWKDAVRNAGQLIRSGAGAVKAEGATALDEIAAIIKAGIPVMGHLGLQPQSVNVYGGFAKRGKQQDEYKQIIDDALRLEQLGVFALVIECVPPELAAELCGRLSIPVIGIGAGKYCDGQVLVWHDLLGFFYKKPPSFVTQYANLASIIEDAIKQYAQDVLLNK